MRIFLIVFLFIACSDTINAQSEIIDKPILCNDAKIIFQILQDEYEEFPIWLGTVGNSNIALFVNSKNKNWSLVEFDKKVGCVLEIGTKSNLRKMTSS